MKQHFTYVIFLFLLTANVWEAMTMNDVRPGAGDENFQVRVFPNPSTSGDFAIEFTNLKKADKLEIAVYNLIGKKVYEVQIQGKEGFFQEALHLGQMAKGIYMLQIKQGENKLIRRLSYV